MAQQTPIRPTEAELEILQVLWSMTTSTVREVYEAISQKKQVQYTTTLKQMQRMLDKGMIGRTGTGKSHVYHAKVEEKSIQTNLFNQLMDTAFNGSAMNLAMHALGKSKASSKELDELSKWLEQMKKTDQ